MTNQELIILAMLSETERYGYEIDTMIKKRLSGFSQKIARSSVYAALKKLLNAGLVSSREILQSGRPPRKVYDISASGRLELERALSKALMPEDSLLGNFDVIILVWPLIPDARRGELLNAYSRYLSEKRMELKRMLSGEFSPVSAAFFERPLAMVEGEIGWLGEFCDKNGVSLALQ